jgi:hypothetical protein
MTDIKVTDFVEYPLVPGSDVSVYWYDSVPGIHQVQPQLYLRSKLQGLTFTLTHTEAQHLLDFLEGKRPAIVWVDEE